MATELIMLSEYCRRCEIDPGFVEVLAEEGMIDMVLIDEDRYIDEEQLRALTRFVAWHYELNINVEGIDAIRHMLEKIQHMQQRIAELEAILSIRRD